MCRRVKVIEYLVGAREEDEEVEVAVEIPAGSGSLSKTDGATCDDLSCAIYAIGGKSPWALAVVLPMVAVCKIERLCRYVDVWV